MHELIYNNLIQPHENLKVIGSFARYTRRLPMYHGRDIQPRLVLRE